MVKKATSYAKADAVFDFDGFDIPIGEPGESGSLSDQVDRLTDDIEELFHFKEQENTSGRSTMLAATFLIGAEYAILDNQLSFGLLSTTRIYRPKAYTELTASVNYRPVDWFAVTLSYSTIHSAFQTFGWAVNFSPKGFNFFLGSDYMITKVNPQFIPVKARAENIYLGMSFPIGTKSSRYRQ